MMIPLRSNPPRFAPVVLAILTIGLVTKTAPLAQSPPETEYPMAKHGGNYMINYYFPPAPSSTPWAPSWSPDGKSIAVAMSGSIWKVDVESGDAEELTADGQYHSSPDWSPDGQWIAYTGDDGQKSIQLRALNLSTGVSQTLTDDEFVYADPVFSPDGDRLAYVSTRPGGYFNVYVRPIKDGHWAGPEVAITKDHDFGRDRLYFGNWDMHLSPAWLPDGRELLIVSNRDAPLGSGNVIRVPASADGITQARTVLAEQTLYRTRPDVSIDGKRFIYTSTRGAADQYLNLYVQPTTGGEPYKMTFFDHDAFHPRWSPDGEWIAYVTNEEGLPQLALLETYGGAQRTIHIARRKWKRPVGTLNVEILDAASMQATAARVHLTASDGRFYAPSDAYARVSAARDRIFHTTGRFSVDLPAGPVKLVTVKGFEYWPESSAMDVRPGQSNAVTIRLRRMSDVSADGWFNGSTHVHMNYAGNLHNSFANLMMMSAAEDQDIVNEQIANKDNRVLDYQYFVKGGGPHPLSTPERLVVVGQEYRPPFYGHVFMFGLREHLISPFTTGYEGTAIESLYPSNTDMFRKARQQGATVGYVHAFPGEKDPLEGNLGGAKGFMVDAALGTTDAVEWSEAGRAGFFPWYAALNNGLHVTAVGGEDSISSLHDTKLVGSSRTFVRTDNKRLEMQGWFDALRQGHAFVSSGPLVELTVNGKIAGDEVTLTAPGDVDVALRVRSIVPLDHVFLVAGGVTVAEVPLSGDRRTATLTRSIRFAQSGWIHLRAEGKPSERFPLDTTYAQAFTNPVWITVAGRPVRNRDAADYGVKWIDKLQKMAEDWPGWRSDREKAHVFAQFEEARQVYLTRRAEADPSQSR